MRTRYAVLLAVLATLLAPVASYGEEFGKEVDNVINERKGEFASHDTGTANHRIDGVGGCTGIGQLIDPSSDGNANESNLCLSPVTSLEELALEFRRRQAAERERHRRERRERLRRRAAERRAERRAAAERSAEYISEGQAQVPRVAPASVKAVIHAANAIAATPYIWGGGHGSFESAGYDCSGAVSYALHGGRLIPSPLDSTGLETWGDPGPGRWITVYANSEHAWMVVAGLAFDTVGSDGPRWHPSPVSSTEGFIARHPAGS